MTDALTALDGRYRSKIEDLVPIFSEGALIRYRYRIEVEYLKFLGNVIGFDLPDKIDHEVDCERVKAIERTTNHDVKAVEYYLREQLQRNGAEDGVLEYVHFGLTSQDINSVTYALQLKDFMNGAFERGMKRITQKLITMAEKYRNIPMLSRTHGQSASPTTIGEELVVFVERLYHQFSTRVKDYRTKFGGAVGNLNAHYAAFPNINWHIELDKFIDTRFGLLRNQHTKQIDHYDHYAITFDVVRRICTILIDLCQDLWLYISHDYFKLKVKEGEVGSSTMPHKVNPIHFENAEGNLQLACALLNFLSTKLPVSRMQRDLTDSTVLRNLGTAFGHVMLGIRSLLVGLDRIDINKTALRKDLDNNWQVVTEAIQTVLRREGVPGAYDIIKNASRGEQLDKEGIAKLIEQLPVSKSVKDELHAIAPQNYIGKV